MKPRPGLPAIAAPALLCAVASVFLWTGRAAAWETVQVALQYAKATYARDFAEAYGLLSSDDRQTKDKESYVRERGGFDGFASVLARKLAGFIKATPVEEKIDGRRARLNLLLRFPDAAKISAHVLGWDEERLDKLSANERSAMIEALERWHQDGKIPMREAAHDFELVREEKGWRLFLDWAAGVRVLLDSVTPGSALIEAGPVLKEVTVGRGKLFSVSFKVKNLSQRAIATWINHRVEPKAADQYLELVECNLLIPVTVPPGSEVQYPSSYQLRGDLPEEIKKFRVTYEFKVEER